MIDVHEQMQPHPVTLFSTGPLPTVALRGRTACRRGAPDVTVDLDGSCDGLAVGDRVIVDCRGNAGFRIVGRVSSLARRRVTVATDRVVERDQRRYPRMVGGITLRYAVVPEDHGRALAAWMAGEAMDDLCWHAPDPFMQFSGGGLRFDDRLSCQPGDRLLLSLEIPTGQGPWRATARVLRTPRIPVDERDVPEGPTTPTHRISLELIDLPEAAREALICFTERIQEALVRGDG
jgi:hypothetical protein